MFDRYLSGYSLGREAAVHGHGPIGVILARYLGGLENSHYELELAVLERAKQESQPELYALGLPARLGFLVGCNLTSLNSLVENSSRETS